MRRTIEIIGDKCILIVLLGILFCNLSLADVAYWKFENSYSTSGPNSPALDAVSGETATFSPDRPGNVVFDNITENSNSANVASYSNGTGTPSIVSNYTILNNCFVNGNFTVEAYVKLTPGGNYAFDAIISNLEATGTSGWVFGLDSSGHLRFGAAQVYNDAFVQTVSSTVLTPDIWHHVAAVGTFTDRTGDIDYADVQLYVDYLPDGNSVRYFGDIASGSAVGPVLRMRSANYTIGGMNPFSGLIDNLRITGTPLNTSQFLVAKDVMMLGNVDVAAAGAYGYRYSIYSQDFGFEGDNSVNPNRSKLLLFEDGMQLGPAHSIHALIQDFGEGRYSHWGDFLHFSTSDNSDPRTNGRQYTWGIYTNAEDKIQKLIKMSTVDPLSGYCYIRYGLAPYGDTITSPQQSVLRVFEDGLEIGPAHSLHTSIQNIGEGRYSHWGDHLRFSTSDNSDPINNGKVYSYTLAMFPIASSAVGTASPDNIANNPTWFVTSGEYIYSICKGSYTHDNNDIAVCDIFHFSGDTMTLVTTMQVGVAGTQVRGIEVYGNTLYLGSWSGYLYVYDISDKTAPELVRTVYTGSWGIQMLHIIDGVLYVPHWSSQIVSYYSISNPTYPVLIDEIDLSVTDSGSLCQMLPYLDYVWCIAHEATGTKKNLHCLDLRDIGNPRVVSSTCIPELKNARYGCIENGILYVGGFGDASRLCAVNIQNPETQAPYLLKAFNFNMPSFIKVGQYLIGSDLLGTATFIADISNWDNPVIAKYDPAVLFYPKVVGNRIFAFKKGDLPKDPAAAPNDSPKGEVFLISEPIW